MSLEMFSECCLLSISLESHLQCLGTLRQAVQCFSLAPCFANTAVCSGLQEHLLQIDKRWTDKPQIYSNMPFCLHCLFQSDSGGRVYKCNFCERMNLNLLFSESKPKPQTKRICRRALYCQWENNKKLF